MFNFLNQPYPITEGFRQQLKPGIGIAVFVFLFLLAFKPFGLNNIEHNQLMVIAGYGLVTFLVILFTNIIIPYFFPSVFNESRWRVYKEIIYLLLVVSIIAAGNLLYTLMQGYSTLSIQNLLYFEAYTLMVAVFPITVMILLKQNVLLKRNAAEARKISDTLYLKKRLPSVLGETITITAENPKDNFTVETNAVYYIAAANNYVEVFYGLQNQEIKKKLLRTTIRSVQGNLKTLSQFYRCHRTYIVNLEKIDRITGNAQGYKLVIKDVGFSIPVSRSLNKEVSTRLSR